MSCNKSLIQLTSKLRVNSGPTFSGAITYFIVSLTISLDKQVIASKKLFGDPTRSCTEFAISLGAVNRDQTYSIHIRVNRQIVSKNEFTYTNLDISYFI
jgi:hypothetical protein